jgi:hypothetical protein
VIHVHDLQKREKLKLVFNRGKKPHEVDGHSNEPIPPVVDVGKTKTSKVAAAEKGKASKVAAAQKKNASKVVAAQKENASKVAAAEKGDARKVVAA